MARRSTSTKLAERNARAAHARAIAAAYAKRSQRLMLATISVGAIVTVIVAMVVVKAAQSSGGSDGTATTTASSAFLNKVTQVPGSALDSVGAPDPPTSLQPITDGSSLTENGKPKVLYIGAEYCPYCAATRWGLAVALSRFGSFDKLGVTSSSSTDVYPNTATLSFHGSTYTSDEIVFTGYETSDRDGNRLDTVTGDDETTFKTLDTAPYVDASSAGSIPFLDIGGKYVLIGSAFDPGVLKGMTADEVAAALSDPSSDVAKAVLGEANAITAAICTTTSQQPRSVCTSSGVQAAAAQLASGG